MLRLPRPKTKPRNHQRLSTMTETFTRNISCESEYDPTEFQNTQCYGYRDLKRTPGPNRDFQQ